ncbi:MAG TPA: DUF3276 family protein [Patescibacteria group bacterium]
MEFAPVLFSTKVHNGARTFFVDVKSAKNNKPYLKITESSISKEGEKKKNYMTVFENEINDFKEAIEQAVGFVNEKTK